MFYENEENPLLGTLGALIGALIGGAVCLFISRLGFIGSVSGVVASYCALFGYEKLGNKLSKKGIVISIVLAIGALIFAWVLDLCWEVAAYYDYQYGNALTMLPYFSMFLSDGYFESGIYINLLMVLVFGCLGAFYRVKTAIACADTGVKFAKSKSSANEYPEVHIKAKEEKEAQSVNEMGTVPSNRTDEAERNLFQ